MNDLQKEEWLAKNHIAHEAFIWWAFKLASTGKKFGFKAVVEKLRWESFFQKEDDESYKWNNSATSYAGRKFIELYPQFANQVSFKEFKSYGNVK